MIAFDRELIQKCQTNAPRYTSYPTADRFNFTYTQELHQQQIQQVFLSSKNITDPISLYIHIPFCNTLCLYCGCNKIITNNRQNIDQYLDYLEQEIIFYVNLIGKKLDVIQLHFGGGSPSWMDKPQVSRVMNIVHKYFKLDMVQEIAMEIDPRHCDASYVEHLQQEGFTRISLGIQDFNLKTQKAVNRVQSYEESNRILESARSCGFKSTNVDLIYGLPFQNLETFTETINTIIHMAPDRIALFNYAHIPSLLMPQTRIKEEDLPEASVKLDILQMSVDKLTKAGYVFIGMDHFALPSDDLSIALKEHRLQRNFQGYSTFKDTNMLAFGISSIGFIGNSYYQNTREINDYFLAIDNKQLPILRGFLLSDDDIIRKDVISRIMCQFALNYSELEQIYQVNFTQYFTQEIEDLSKLEQLGLIQINQSGFAVSDAGRFLIRNIAVVFDKYFRENRDKTKYSKVI